MVKLSKRLNAVANLITVGSRLADVGCDHGYVPAYLMENNLIKSAIACDINQGPLSSCANLVNQLNLNNIECRLSNGLEKVSENEVDDILIAGMGGELIVKILDNCSYSSQKHLILNPATHGELVRQWLYDNGFSIAQDIIVKDGKHYYSIFDATYTGEFKDYNLVDCYLGNIKNFEEKGYFDHLKNYLLNKQKSGVDYSTIIKAIEDKYDNC